MIGKTDGYISLLETGRAPLTDNLKRCISEALGCDINILRNYDESYESGDMGDTDDADSNLCGAAKRVM